MVDQVAYTPGGIMKSSRLHKRGRQALRDLVLPEPFSVETLCKSIADQRGRPLRLLPLPMEFGERSPCGMWIGTELADFILFEENTSPFHRDHIILHEIGHLLCDHSTAPEILDLLNAAADSEIVPSVVRLAMGRTSYSTAQEQEAETIASLILCRAWRADESMTPDDHWLGSVLGIG